MYWNTDTKENVLKKSLIPNDFLSHEHLLGCGLIRGGTSVIAY
jgi:hypothetical protein